MEEPMMIDLITPIKPNDSTQDFQVVGVPPLCLEDADDNAMDVPETKSPKIQKIISEKKCRKTSSGSTGRSFNFSRSSLGSTGSHSDLLRKNVLLKQTEISLSSSINYASDSVVNDSAEKLLIEQKDEDGNVEVKLKDSDTRNVSKEPAPSMKTVKRSKRSYRVFIFTEEENEKVEKIIIKAEKVEKVPKDINGRKPFWLVRGVQYELGEGVGVDLEEDEEVVKKYRNENYDMDSFCMEAGYLSEDEMFETPKNDKVISNLRKKRRAQAAKSTLKFGNLGEPEVVGCFWVGGKCGKEDEETKKKKKELKKWSAFISIPDLGTIPTHFSSPIPASPKPAPASNILSQNPCSKLAPVVQPREEDYATKYAVKYYVKRKLEGALCGARGSMATSTPRIGSAKASVPSDVLTPAHFIRCIKEECDGANGGLVAKMLPEQKEVLRKASCLDLSRLKTELLSSSSIPEDFKKHSENLLNEYRRFLVLKVIFGDTSPPISLSPSAIIDQVWHLHLLMPLHYAKCCRLLGEEVVDHDPSGSRDGVELRQKRLDMTKRSYKIAFGEAPPDKFWALQYQLLPQQGAGRRQLNINPESVKTTKRSYEKAFKEKQDNSLAKLYRPGPLAITYQPNTGKDSDSENDQRKENRNPVSDEAEMINIRVDIMGRDLITFKMRGNTRMKNLYDRIEQMGYGGYGTFRLVFDAKWINGADTIDSLQMEDMEVIEMYPLQSGC